MNAGVVDVSQHARTRWLQRVSPDDPYPGTSIREAFSEASTTNSDWRIRRYHRDFNAILIAVKRGGITIVVTVYRAGRSEGEKT